MHDPRKRRRGEAEINSVHVPRFCLSLHNALNTLPVGYATTFYTGRLQTLTLVYTVFDKKGTPFTYLVYTFASLLIAIDELYLPYKYS